MDVSVMAHPMLSSAVTSCLALQFAAQPFLMKQFVSPAVICSSVVLAGEAIKLTGCLAVLWFTGRLPKLWESWTLSACLQQSLLPAAAYAMQNYAGLYAYQMLDGVTFNVLAQTKLLFTALFVYVLNGTCLSHRKITALVMITMASTVTVLCEGTNGGHPGATVVGVFAAIVASSSSGLGAALSEYALVQNQRDVLLFSAELAAIGMLVVGLNLSLDLNGDSTRMAHHDSLFVFWTPLTYVPVITTAVSGVLVGVVTKALGSVRKMFTVTVGLMLSIVIRTVLEGHLPSTQLLMALALVVTGVRMYSEPPKTAKSGFKVVPCKSPRRSISSGTSDLSESTTDMSAEGTPLDCLRDLEKSVAAEV